MTLERKSKEEAKTLGQDLKQLRVAVCLTLQQVAVQTEVDVGQLSRFERGDFKKLSTNLQKYREFLQKQNLPVSSPSTQDLSLAVLALAGRSERHRAATHAVLQALDSLN